MLSQFLASQVLPLANWKCIYSGPITCCNLRVQLATENNSSQCSAWKLGKKMCLLQTQPSYCISCLVTLSSYYCLDIVTNCNKTVHANVCQLILCGQTIVCTPPPWCNEAPAHPQYPLGMMQTTKGDHHDAWHHAVANNATTTTRLLHPLHTGPRTRHRWAHCWYSQSSTYIQLPGWPSRCLSARNWGFQHICASIEQSQM